MTQGQALLISIVVEAACAAALLGVFGLGLRGLLRSVLAAALATVATHPFAWAAFLALYRQTDPWTAAAIVEPGVALAEAPLYRFLVPLSWPAAVAVSVAANAVSYLTGLAIHALL